MKGMLAQSRFFAVAALACVVLAACGEQASQSQQAMQKWVGTDVAALQVQTLDGDMVTLTQDVRPPFVLNIWATWCTPCIKELPSLDALARLGVPVVAVSTDADVETIQAFMRDKPWGSHLKLYHDPLGKITRSALGAIAIPVTYGIGQTGTVQMVEAGERDWAHPRMQAKVQQALGVVLAAE